MEKKLRLIPDSKDAGQFMMTNLRGRKMFLTADDFLSEERITRYISFFILV